MMHLIMRVGRAHEAKKTFYKQVTEKLAPDLGIDLA